MANTKIVLNRQSDLILDNAQITNPEGIVIADISGLVSTVESIDAQESTNMSTEVVNRVAGDASIAANLSTELIERENAISTEASLRVVGDVSVTAAMSAEISSRIVAETSLANDIEAEASTGLVRDQAEASMARAAEQSLATDLDAEQSRAESAEASLNAKVENVISNVDPAALDSLTEIVGAFQSADGDLNGAITALGSTATAAVDAEASIRLSADESIAANLSSELVDRAAAVSTEEAARISGDVSVALDLSSEIQARISDVDAEQARAESAEASLEAAKLDLAGGTMSGNIDMAGGLIDNVDRVNADSILTGNIYVDFISNYNGDNTGTFTIDSNIDLLNHSITNLAAPTNGGDATNKTYVDGEISTEVSRAESAELSLSNLLGADVSAEASIRLAADESLDSALSAEISRAEAAEASIAEELSSEVSYIIANTDLTSIDSFAEVVADMSSEVSRAESAEASIALDFANIYAKHVAVNETPNGTLTAFTIATPVREGSELVYMNGLLLDAGDYTPNMVSGKVAGFTFINAPLANDKVNAYGVC